MTRGEHESDAEADAAGRIAADPVEHGGEDSAGEPGAQPEGRPAGGRVAWRRWLGFAVAGLLLWLVLHNVPWRDTLRLSPASSSEVETFTGSIEGDWKGDAIEFRFDADQELAADSVLRDHPFATTPEVGGTLEVSVDTLAGRAWAVDANGTPTETGPELSLAPVVAEWRPGLPRAFGDLDVGGLLPALGFLVLATLLVSTRWWRLLAISGCRTDWWTAFRLTYVGLFFNFVIPGSTGGDLARAYVVVRDHPERRARALMSVMVDRLVGLVAMALLATIAVYTNDERFGSLRLGVSIALAAMVFGLVAFINPHVRRLVRFDAIVARLPQARRLQKLDTALREYGEHPGELALALLLSLGNHFCATAAAFWIGHAFGDQLSFHDYLCIVSVANTLTAIPISPGGLGVGEVLFGALFQLGGGMRLLGVATSFVYRLVLVTLGLGGGLFLLLPGGAAVRRDFRDAGHD